MSPATAPNIAVIGAGIAGLAAARTLRDAGLPVVVFEKSRGRGGRAATRRLEDRAFDHGAQYFTARDPVFRRAVGEWMVRAAVAVWSPRPGRVEGERAAPSPDGVTRYVAVPGMSALGRHLGSDLDIRAGTRVVAPRRRGSGWALEADNGEVLGAFDLLVVAVPAPQAAALLASAAPKLAAIAAAVPFAPCWTTMVTPRKPVPLPFDALFFADGPLAWAAADGSKPGRRGDGWVLQATPTWSRNHLEATANAVAAALTDAFAATAGVPATSLGHAASHRWRYARAEAPLGRDFLWAADLNLGVCGDWCRGARVEEAYLSGRALAEAVMRRFLPPPHGAPGVPRGWPGPLG